MGSGKVNDLQLVLVIAGSAVAITGTNAVMIGGLRREMRHEMKALGQELKALGQELNAVRQEVSRLSERVARLEAIMDIMRIGMQLPVPDTTTDGKASRKS